jgi:hypothetical protein
MMNLAVFCHDENSPFAQPEDCLSVANYPFSRKPEKASAYKTDARSARDKTQRRPKALDADPAAGVAMAPGKTS